MTLQKKVEDISRKIEKLKFQQQKIETDLAHQILEVIKTQSGFNLPFNALVGGLLEVIETCKIDPNKSEEWQYAGEKFLKSRHKSNTRATKATRNSESSSRKNVRDQETVNAKEISKDITKQLPNDITNTGATTVDVEVEKTG